MTSPGYGTPPTYPRDINAPFRERSAARDWSRVHVDSDARAPAGMYQPSRLSRLISRFVGRAA